MNTNGSPRKSKPKKSKRLRNIEASFDALCAIANEGRVISDDEDKRHEIAMAYLQKAELPLGDDTAEFFMPDEDEIIFMIASMAQGYDSLASSLAAMKASTFMHGYLHAQIEDGVRDEAGKIL